MKTSSNTLKKKLKLVANSAGAVSILFTVRFMSFHPGNNNDNRNYKFPKLATELFYSNGFILILQAKLGKSNKKNHCLSYLHLVQYPQMLCENQGPPALVSFAADLM